MKSNGHFLGGRAQSCMRQTAHNPRRAVPFDEVLVAGHGVGALLYGRADVVELGLDLARVQAVGHRIVAARHHVLADHHRQPALNREEFGVLP